MNVPRPPVTFALVVVSGVVGIGLTIFFGTASDGGRGGAVGLALSLAILFAGPPNDERPVQGQTTVRPKLRDPLTPEPSPLEVRVERLEADVTALRNTGAAGRERDRIEKLWLAAASAVGTLFWGFGDVAARWLGAATECCA